MCFFPQKQSITEEKMTSTASPSMKNPEPMNMQMLLSSNVELLILKISSTPLREVYFQCMSCTFQNFLCMIVFKQVVMSQNPACTYTSQI